MIQARVTFVVFSRQNYAVITNARGRFSGNFSATHRRTYHNMGGVIIQNFSLFLPERGRVGVCKAYMLDLSVCVLACPLLCIVYLVMSSSM